ncbi:AmpG family muropeptide MFS transporter [Thauera mechernichensis]|uniref:AmpG family muropeptide MFS transporter n=1 Tax=Thauera mechernichensis TaxID=82788 RepID=A0ABW3WIB1_9RHOO|nr:AmpG family muropeptide MFS transporter [Thauera mechernichensis]HAY08749.1 AmpG family muropeptide MFS transporter [Thauera sp.]MDG3065229.1 AmpG family muropeptide MFS transporter [Thauera mechernichensis]HNR60132.1 AmpG family muropeptide MFS transporter [Thauera sp.]HNS91695.1 AmpG family muropeptide MFS transporter [Thauera sp.]HRJ24012.1 AmpG family muropeptide MFS transporter [Thauera sp.]
MPLARPAWLTALLNRRMLICIFTGFASGLPLYLLLNLVPAWLKTEGLSLKAIGAFALIQFPYTWKFLWAPLLDRYGILPWLGRRRSWMFVSQLGLLASIAWLGQLSPVDHLALVVGLTAALALLSATQDIALDAFRREILPDAELGLGNAIHVNAYRIAGLVPGSLSLILADHLPWSQVFVITAAFMIPGLAMTLLVKEPLAAAGTPRTLRDAVVEPFREFFGRHGVQSALLVLAFLFFYKLGDSLCTALATPFYLDMGYSKTEIGVIAKNAGLWPMVIGGILGGIWMLKLGINRALWIFGVVQFVTILGFVWMAWLGPGESTPARLVVLATVIAGEAIGAGLGTTAFVAFMARSTHPAYTATQLALFTSLMAVPRTFINATAGWLVEALGWTNFFWLCFALAVPGMLLLFKVAPWHGDRSPRTEAATA